MTISASAGRIVQTTSNVQLWVVFDGVGWTRSLKLTTT